ncbi:protein translocase subunit SecD [Thermocrinis minervae]|uniref:Protein translocase subunit SecD n=1 Tax=Thermocrinis minervae TaxID=381751 RepID=A0A1M6TKN3_9AQUI|nr:protein translocase subunit SecD [Thermocrinis minervae]SHK57473.1 preprotein translocase subunit SecD [Thermocrinis minervae]
MKNLWLNLGIFFALVFACLIVLALKPINLGLDLKGGSSIVLEPDIQKAIKDLYERQSSYVEKLLSDKGIKVLDVSASKESIKVELLDKDQLKQAVKVLEENLRDYELTVSDGNILLRLKDAKEEDLVNGIVSQTVEVLRRRIDELGVVQPVITKLGRDRILVELPGVLDIQRAKSIIGRTAVLELKLVVDSGPKEELQKRLTKDLELLPSKEGVWFLVEKTPVITGKDIRTAYTSQDEFGAPAVSFELTSEGAKAFAEATEKNIGKRLAIVLDGVVMSAPVIRSKISDKGQITGRFTPEEARDLALVLRSGSLPTEVKFLQESVVGPSLGRDAIEQAKKAGFLGSMLLFALLIARYKTTGVSAVVSIIFNVLLLLSSLVLLGATLTLPGIAGIILNMGIAVDSNVLIYERIREELRLGNSPRKAIELGYRRTLGAVWDTHITLLVAALILFQFGSGPVKGFATTLTLGTIASFISNVYYAKFFLEVLHKLRLFKL